MSILQGLCGTNTGLYAAWKGETGDDRLFLASCTSGNWTDLGTIPGNSDIGPSLAMVGDTLYACWKGQQDDQRLFYATYANGGWTTPAQPTLPGNSSIGPSLANVEGTLYCAWKGEVYDQRLFFSQFQNGAWQPQKQIHNVTSSIGPSIAGLGNYLYAAWKGPDSDQNLYYAYYDGSQWHGPYPIAGASSSVGPSLVVANNTLFAAWKQANTDQSMQFASFANGAWTVLAALPGASSIGPALAAVGDTIYAMWKGMSDDQRLWYASYPGAPQQWSGQNTLPGNTGPDIIRLIFIPDIHLEETGQPQTWQAQTQWISKNWFNYNVQAVFCAGDFVISGAGGNVPTDTPGDDEPSDLPFAWQQGFAAIDAIGKPYLTSAGNHDYDDLRDTQSFDQYISYQRIFQKPWYAGYWPAPGVAPLANPGTPAEPAGGYSSLATQAIRFDVGARQFLIIALEFMPRQAAMDWAAGIINQFPTCEVIILNHGYMHLSNGDVYTNADNIAAGLPPFTPGLTTGVQVNAWALSYPAIRLILCGHDVPTALTPHLASRTDARPSGQPTLLGVCANYQFPANSGTTSQVILLLEISQNQLNVRAFNTSTNQECSAPFPFTMPWS